MVVFTPFAFFNAAGRRWLVLAALGGLSSQCQPNAPAGQPATSPNSPKLETAVATPLPKVDAEAPIMRQLALLPPAERAIAPATMRRYQQLTRRFWLAEYYTEHLLKQAQSGPPNVAVFAQQVALTQGHWRVVAQGLREHPPMPPTMTSHLARMQQVTQYQQAALTDLQADRDAQRAPQPDAFTLAAQQEVKKLLEPLLRKPRPLEVRVR